MDSRHAEVLAQTDRTALGRRLRSARLARGLTQGEVATDLMSVAYLSRIETGHRRPTVTALGVLSERLGVTVESLLGVADRRVVDEIRLALDYAELSLESGQPGDAEQHLEAALDQMASARIDDMRDRARLLHARALEATKQVDDAILELEALIEEQRTDGLTLIKAGIALSRIYRETGDLGRAIACGERVMARVEEAGLDASDEGVQLAVTVAAAHFERGDTSHAVRLCRKAITKAESLGSPMARASAYWNASVMQANRGDVVAAVPLAERALALLSEGQDARNLARLRTEVGRLQLELDPPALAEARDNLQQAALEMEWSSASPVDRAWTLLGLARVSFLGGDLDESRELLSQVHTTADGHAPLAEAEALTLEGRTLAAEGRSDLAAAAYQRAVLRLSAIGADQSAAQLWFDLADLLGGVGLTEESLDAYRRAAVSTGLRARVSTHTLARS
ncbi:helix-turn-helix domain-containing protein [Nocardioides hwasunensis]|uniref:Helix-turn-helix domain-containing protein n=1 Tax=Nocardioides hwasunensis TaxID=397258 RepID=A0ABR8MLA2_9ACTN|nr:helix-turn-helix transcriptional regulator [Nocardioides hwasunensis]MBD3916787.1 helix-turn-helix domain-containing protein [Nocardioides hwasunensis]